MNVIVMSTYDGAKYLGEQLDSVLSQTVSDFVLLVRDDGSTDDTVQILKTYDDPRIRILAGENLGPSGSFFALLEEARRIRADAVFFCDQDDIWMPNKLETLLQQLQQLPEGPGLVFSDFSMVDGTGAVTGNSYTDMAKLRIAHDGNFFPKLLAQPYVFGCACGLNRELLDRIQNPPEGIEMYDCWIGLVCSILGTVRYLPFSTLHHRFHTGNATGRAGMNSIFQRLRRITGQFKQQVKNTAVRLSQAQLLLDRYGTEIPESDRQMLADLAQASRKGGFSAVRTLKKYDVSRGGFAQNMFFYITAFMSKGDN